MEEDYMKQILFVVLTLWLSVIYTEAQESVSVNKNIITHILQRGESIEYLAEIYDVDIDSIKAANNELECFYAGMSLYIPMQETKENSIYAENEIANISHTLSLFKADNKTADELLSNMDYKKAQKLYSQIINKYNATEDCTDAYYGRALCLYNRGKWKSAIKDFQTVLNGGKASYTVSKQCKELLADAQQRREEQLQNRAELWGGIFLTAATVGTSIAIAANQEKSQASSSSSASYGASASTSDSEDTSYTASTSSASSGKSSCPSLKAARGKYYCCNTGRCGMCGGDGLMDDGIKVNQFKCTLCGGTGRCKYCQ